MLPRRRRWRLPCCSGSRRHQSVLPRCTNVSRRCMRACGATPPDWPPMRSAKPSRPEQACLPWHPPQGLVAGVDEAGRGPLAGPVVAAAVILDDLRPIAGLADSKKLTAARREARGLRLKPTLGLVDGNRLPVLDVPAEAIVKGDALVAAISAASILAKVHRDRWCAQVHAQFPQYGFAGHKGYGTAAHLAALNAHGACPLHRRSFAPVAQNLRPALESAA